MVSCRSLYASPEDGDAIKYLEIVFSNNTFICFAYSWRKCCRRASPFPVPCLLQYSLYEDRLLRCPWTSLTDPSLCLKWLSSLEKKKSINIIESAIVFSNTTTSTWNLQLWQFNVLLWQFNVQLWQFNEQLWQFNEQLWQFNVVSCHMEIILFNK